MDNIIDKPRDKTPSGEDRIDDMGGMVYFLRKATGIIMRSIFLRNSIPTAAERVGGALYIDDGSDVRISYSIFETNRDSAVSAQGYSNKSKSRPHE